MGTRSSENISLILLGRTNELGTEGHEPAGKSLLCISSVSVCIFLQARWNCVSA